MPKQALVLKWLHIALICRGQHLAFVCAVHEYLAVPKYMILGALNFGYPLPYAGNQHMFVFLSPPGREGRSSAGWL